MRTLDENLVNITTLLNDLNFHAVTSIGAQLAVTQTAVSEAIQKLISYDVPIQSVTGKGYALLEPLILLNKKTIKQNLTNNSIPLEVFEQITSTNDYLKKFSHEKNMRICIAETQIQGKGRFQRPWHSPFGQNIYLSLLYPFAKDVSELAGLSLITGLAICHTINETISLPHAVKVKWPNDIVCDNQKLAGTLIEVSTAGNGHCNAIIGIGLNVNMTHDSAEHITQPWTSIKSLNNHYHDRNTLCARLINQLLAYYVKFENRGLAAFQDEWKANDFLLNKSICLKSGNQKYQGKIIGISAQGHLLLESEDGSCQQFSSGETTVIK